RSGSRLPVLDVLVAVGVAVGRANRASRHDLRDVIQLLLRLRTARRDILTGIGADMVDHAAAIAVTDARQVALAVAGAAEGDERVIVVVGDAGKQREAARAVGGVVEVDGVAVAVYDLLQQVAE